MVTPPENRSAAVKAKAVKETKQGQRPKISKQADAKL